MDSYGLTIPGDYNYYGFWGRKRNYKKEICRGRLILMHYITKKEDSEGLKIKFTDSIKEERVIINNVSLY